MWKRLSEFPMLIQTIEFNRILVSRTTTFHTRLYHWTAVMTNFVFNPSRFRTPEKASTQYRQQLERLARDGKQVDCIERTVDEAMANLASADRTSFVIYGEP